MKSDKELDIKSIVRQSLKDAMKTHGMVKEQKQVKKRYTKRPFDKETDMPKVELKTAEWKDPKKPSAQALDAVLEPLIVKGSSATETYKKTIENISEVLGMKISQDGIPVRIPSKAEGQGLNNVRQLLSSLQTKDIIHSIIFYHEAQAAGKMFEGLVARILGGTAKFDEINPIQDIEADTGEFISLKLISEKSKDFKGSKFNLAKGINKVGKVTYLILVKSSENNPFSVKAYSFDVTKQNYFSLICGRLQEELDDQRIYNEASRIVKPSILNVTLQKALKMQNNQQEFDKYLSDIQKITDKYLPAPKRHQRDDISLGQLDYEEINNAVIRYAKENNENFSDLLDALVAKEQARSAEKKKSVEDIKRSLSREILKKYISTALEQIVNSLGESDLRSQDALAIKYFFKNYLTSLDPSSKDYLLNMFPLASTGAKSFMTDYPDKLNAEYAKLQGLPDLERYALLEPNEKYKQILLKRAKEDAEGKEDTSLTKDEISILNSLTDEDGKSRYDRIFKGITSKIIDVSSVINTIRKYAYEGSQLEKTTQAAKETSSLVRPSITQGAIIDAFFDSVAQEGSKLESDKKAGIQVETQFNIRPFTALEIAKRTNSNYDEKYPIFYIQKDWIMMSSQENVKLLDEILVPFFSGVHDIKSGLEQYFTYDEVEGLSETDKGLATTKGVLDKHIEKFKDLKASEITPEKVNAAEVVPEKSSGVAKQIQENVKPPLTRDWLDVMFDEID